MLKDIMEKIKTNPIYFSYYDQENDDVEEVLKKEMKLKNVPEQVLEFYEEIDGVTLTTSEIFSLDEIQIELEENFEEFLAATGYSNKDKYVPIADDGLGGYYCFKSGIEDDTIYYLDKDNSDRPLKYIDFEEFLEEIYNIECDDQEDDYNSYDDE